MSQRFHLGSQSANNCSGVSVTVNSGHPAGYVPGSAVTVRPLLTQASTATPRQQAIAKVLLKAVNRKKKTAGAKTFTLRNVNPSIINTCSQMKALIRDQLQNDITEGNFDIGYMQSNTVISIRSKEDLAEIWANLKKGTNITLWCDGLRVATGAGISRQKRHHQTNSDSDVDSGDEDNPPSKKKSKEDRVQKIVDDLKKQHGEKYTIMQYRIWAETVNGGMHKSTTEPPSSSMFSRAGGVSTSGNKRSASNDAVSEAITQITSALTPRLVSLPPSKSNSPAKTIDNRSKCYRQLGELKSLFESGLLSEAEYAAEREAIMSTLQKLSETGK